MRRTHHTTGRRRSRGYTLVELAVVVVLSTVLVFGMARWLVGIGYSAKVGFQDAADRSRHLAVEQFSQDIAAVRWCTPAASDARIRELSSESISMVVGDGAQADTLVTWRVVDGALQRGEAALDGACEATISAWVTWVEGVDVAEFSQVRDGAVNTAGTAGPCPHEWYDRCQVENVQLRLSTSGDPSESAIVVEIP
jgi:type II secretory pathway pseudopilin PulG